MKQNKLNPPDSPYIVLNNIRLLRCHSPSYQINFLGTRIAQWYGVGNVVIQCKVSAYQQGFFGTEREGKEKKRITSKY